jgi:hypothetical protein
VSCCILDFSCGDRRERSSRKGRDRYLSSENQPFSSFFKYFSDLLCNSSEITKVLLCSCGVDSICSSLQGTTEEEYEKKKRGGKIGWIVLPCQLRDQRRLLRGLELVDGRRVIGNECLPPNSFLSVSFVVEIYTPN